MAPRFLAFAVVAAALAALPARASAVWLADGPAEHTIVWAIGDADGRAAHAMAARIRRSDPDRVLYLGDVYPDGGRGAFVRFHRAFGSVIGRMAPTPGNHEWRKRTRADGYIRFWRLIHGASPPQWYSFRSGGWTIMSLNSETHRRTEMLAWLRNAVASGGTCRIAFWHIPYVSAGAHGSSNRMGVFWRALRGRARLVLSGHDHNLQRFHSRGSLIQLVAGAGGRERYPVYRKRGLAFGDDEHWGAIRLSLRPGYARVTFVSGRGRSLDSTLVRCRP